MGGSVFLSHASDDKEKIVSLGLIQALQNSGLTVIVDRPESFGGLAAESMSALVSIKLDEWWRPGLSRLLQRSDVVLACWSTNYAKRFTPELDPSKGQYLRDETAEARSRGYLVNVVVDQIKRYPAPYSTLETDQQILKLFTLVNNRIALENGLRRLTEAISKRIRSRRATEIGPLFESRAWSAIRFLNREEQEQPLMPGAGQRDASSLYILFGPKAEDPEQLYERFRQFTMPAHDEQRKQTRAWNDISRNYMKNLITLNAWRRPVISWPQDSRSIDYALAQIANQLTREVPPTTVSERDTPLAQALRAIQAAGALQGISYFAYSFIPIREWAARRGPICALIEALGRELANGPSDHLRFLLVVETESDLGLFRRLFKWINSSAGLGKSWGSSANVDVKGRPIWHRLPDLSPVKDTDLSAWAGMLAEVWGLDPETPRLLFRESFKGGTTSFAPASKELIENILPELWLRSMARTELEQDKPQRAFGAGS
jgi:hypothetical protein